MTDYKNIRGKKVKELRKIGIVPVHIYGHGIESQSLQAETQILQRIIPRVGTNIPLALDLEGESEENICFVREVQHHPVTEELLHVDFLRVDVTRVTQADVPISLTGTAPAVRELGGTLLQPTMTLAIEALPMNIPASLQADVSALDDFEKAVYVRDVTLPSEVTLLTNPSELIARVSPPRIEVEEVEVEGDEFEIGDGEGEVEGDQSTSDDVDET